MKSKLWSALGSLIILGLVASACAPAAPPTPAPLPTRTITLPSAPTVAPQPTPTTAPIPAKPTSIPAEAGKPRYSGILRTVKPEDPIHYDLHQTGTIAALDPLGPAYDGLVQFDPLDPSRIIPNLAERWEVSPDGLVYTFQLHKGVKWHDGQPFTAADVKISLERIKKPPEGMLRVWDLYLERVKEVQVVDDYTVKLIMDKLDTSLIPHLGVSFIVIYPRHVLEKYGDMKKVVMGTGPYKFKDRVAGTSVSLVRNPDYFVEGRPFLDGIISYVIPDASSRFAALRTGRLDFFPSYPPLSISERAVLAKEKSPIVVQTRPGLAYRSSTFNFKRKPWGDARVRRAVSLAADRQAIIRVAEQGDGVLGAALLPGNWGMPLEEVKQLPGYRYPKDADIAEAKRLLAEAGFPDGFETTFLTRVEPLYVNNAVALQDEVRKIGIRAKLQPLERAASDKAQLTGNFDVYSGSTSLRLEHPSELGLQYVTGGWKNYGGYDNPKINSLFDRLLSTLDVAEQKAIALEMQRILLEDNPQIIHYWTNATVAHWPYVRNYKIGDMYTNNRLLDVWMDK